MIAVTSSEYNECERLRCSIDILIMIEDQDAISLKFRSSFFSTKYPSLGVNLPPKSFSETAPRVFEMHEWINLHWMG